MATDTMQSVDVTTEAIDVSSLKSIEVAGEGWRDIQNCELVQFAIGIAHSPISPQKLYPTLRYQDSKGKQVRTPLSNVLSFSTESMGSSR